MMSPRYLGTSARHTEDILSSFCRALLLFESLQIIVNTSIIVCITLLFALICCYDMDHFQLLHQEGSPQPTRKCLTRSSPPITSPLYASTQLSHGQIAIARRHTGCLVYGRTWRPISRHHSDPIRSTRATHGQQYRLQPSDTQ